MNERKNNSSKKKSKCSEKSIEAFFKMKIKYEGICHFLHRHFHNYDKILMRFTIFQKRIYSKVFTLKWEGNMNRKGCVFRGKSHRKIIKKKWKKPYENIIIQPSMLFRIRRWIKSKQWNNKKKHQHITNRWHFLCVLPHLCKILDRKYNFIWLIEAESISFSRKMLPFSRHCVRNC